MRKLRNSFAFVDLAALKEPVRHKMENDPPGSRHVLRCIQPTSHEMPVLRHFDPASWMVPDDMTGVTTVSNPLTDLPGMITTKWDGTGRRRSGKKEDNSHPN